MSTLDTTQAEQSTTGSGNMRAELGKDAEKLKTTAMSRATEAVESRKGQATEAARSASSALDKAADDLRQDDAAPDWLASAFKQAASGIERLAGSVENRDPQQIGREVSSFARENPTAFLAASAAAGFAAARFLRAGAEYQHHQPQTGGYGQQGATDSSTTLSSSAGDSSVFTGMNTSSSALDERGTSL